MNKVIRISVSLSVLLILWACNLFGPPSAIGDTSVVRLAVQTQNGANTFSQVGETITYTYAVTNTGNSALAGPVLIVDGSKQVNCPAVNTVGNLDNYLDRNETITCTAPYVVSQADYDAGSIINTATATVGSIISNQSGVTLTRNAAQPSSVLILTKTASSQTYGQVGQTITYNFVVTNIGTTPIGPAQFTITDNKLGAPFNCGPGETTLQPNQPLNCSAPYIITQADMALPSLVNSATASGGGQTSAPATATVTNLTAPATQPPTILLTATVAPPANLTPGGTVYHPVAVGEWLMQIARCYGATFSEVRNANPQIADPNVIFPADRPNGTTVTVPRIGSAGTIYGPPCVTFVNVQSGDTWTSLAQRYNADVAVLQRANPAGLVVGKPARIPLNSAGSVPVTVVPTVGTGPTAGPTAAPAAQRINFPAGQTNVNLAGFVNPNQTIQYVVNTTQGQVLGVKLNATPANEVSIGVNGPTGLALKPLDPTPTWNTTITTGGDHIISIFGAVGSSSKSYTLEVSLTSPATVPTSTVAPTAAAGTNNSGEAP